MPIHRGPILLLSKQPNKVAHSLHRLVKWLTQNVAFISWHKHWKGVYLHCVHPRCCVRVYLWGIDWHQKHFPQPRKPSNGKISREAAQ